MASSPLHGTSRSITLTAQELAPMGKDRHFVATTVIDRHDFLSVRTNADALIGSQVRVDLDEVFVHEPPTQTSTTSDMQVGEERSRCVQANL